MKSKYGDDYIVLKEECVENVQKRLGSALGQYKNSIKESSEAVRRQRSSWERAPN